MEVKNLKQGELFLAARRKVRMTQLEVANIVGVDRSTISFIEKGKSYPSFELFKKLIVVYKTTPNKLLELDSVRNETERSMQNEKNPRKMGRFR